MNTNLTFKELAEKGRKILEKQPPVTFEQAKAQVERLKNASIAQRLEYLPLKQGVLSSNLSGSTKTNDMGKIEKKKAKILERISSLEEEMRLNLKQKTSSTAEISISEYQTKINNLRKEYASLA